MQNVIINEELNESSCAKKALSIPESEESENPAALFPAELRDLDTAIGNLADNFCARLRKLAKSGGKAEIKPAFRAFIYTLEEMYVSIPEYE